PAQPARIGGGAAVARPALGERRRRLPARLDAVVRPRPLLLQRARPLRFDVERSMVPAATRGRDPVDRGPVTWNAKIAKHHAGTTKTRRRTKTHEDGRKTT